MIKKISNSLSLVLLSIAVSISEGAKPNIVIIFNDDQGYEDLGSYGSPTIRTPHVDQLAREGMRFTDFYVTSSVCSPSRASLLTGKFPDRVGVPAVFFPNRPGGLDPEHVTMAEVLRDAGYATAAIGKWHLGDEPQYLPTNQGFDEYFGIPYSNDMFPSLSTTYAEDCLFRDGWSEAKILEKFKTIENPGHAWVLRDVVPLLRDTEAIEFPADQTTLTRRYASEGMRFISESVEAGKPFFLFLAHSMPHVPLFTEERFIGASLDGPYGDTIEEIDYHTGRMMDHLKDLGIEDNTVFIFTSDNGPWLVKGRDAGRALPLFEGKMTYFEGGVRVPFVIRWPAQIPAGRVIAEPATTMDLMPTFAEILGIDLQIDGLDGHSIKGILTGGPEARSPHEYIFYDRYAVRQGKWKYHRKEIFKVPPTSRLTDGPSLYDLEADIGETTNLIEDYPDVAERLAAKLSEHLEYIGVQLD
ncbi:MAG: sulfatase family protein [Opitutales bacterium]